MKQETFTRYMHEAYDLFEAEKFAEAEKVYRPLLKASPTNPEVLRLLAVTLGNQGRHEEALPYARLAVASDPAYQLAWANLGQTLGACGHYDESITACATALDLDPTLENARYTRGLSRLAKGDWCKGWKDYESGLACGLRGPRYSDERRWRGGPLDPSATLVLWYEQGLGDTIQFIRFVRNAKAWAGCTVVVEVQPELLDLLYDMPGADQVVAAKPGMVVTHDYHCPLMSLPYIYGLEPKHLTGEPYIEPTRTLQWIGKVTQRGGWPVGFLWKGNPNHQNDKNRSIPFPLWADLLHTHPCHFHSLALGESQHDFKSVADLAGIIDCMRLVITVDTMVAHLAGAMGVPTWLLLPYAPDWRWGLKSAGTPWYKYMRLYRQTERGDWEGVMRRVKTDLVELTKIGVIENG